MTDPIKAKIIELVPEIVEVKQGCAIAIKSMYSAWGDKMMGRYGTSDWVFDGVSHLRNKEGAMSFDEYLKHVNLCYVVGRRVTLADVLRAIEMQQEAEEDWVVISTNGVFFKMDCETGEQYDNGENVQWNLLHDYDNQTQEVKEFVGKLIGVETL